MKNSEAILVTPKHFEIQECPVPEPKDHEILMKVEYVGMCGSDIHGFEFGPFIPPKDPKQNLKSETKCLSSRVFRMIHVSIAVQAVIIFVRELTLWQHSRTIKGR